MSIKRVFSLTTYGLEDISAAEMAVVPGLTMTGNTYRRLSAQCPEASLPALLKLHTVDDVYLDVGMWEDIKHTRDTLKLLEEKFHHLDLEPAVETIATIRPIPARPVFSVTSSFIGKRNYNADEIKTAVATGITAHHNWHYTADDREADLNVRLFIVDETAVVGLRLGKHALHERDYEKIQRPGALKPSVAAALLKLVNFRAGMTLLDPCCGTGTILIEGAQLGAMALGGDIDPEALKAAETNGHAAGVNMTVKRWDALALPVPDHSVDCIVTNPPWGRQVPAKLEPFYDGLCHEMERVLAPGGKLVVLTSLPELLHFEHLQPDREPPLTISLYGMRPAVAVYASIP